MSYSRRQLYAMGEPIGDSATYRKADGGLVLGGGGGGGGGGTGTQTNISELPEWARGYAKGALERADALSRTGYQKYTDPRIAGFSPLQQQAQEGAAKMQTSGLTGIGGQVAGEAALRGLGQNYQGGQFEGGRFGGQQAAQYMSPFIEQALAPQLREAQRSSDIMGQQNAAKAVGQGACGGSRSALVEAERQRNLGMQMGDIRAKGLQDAYTQAANQFNADQQRAMQAQQLGEQSRQFGANLGMQGLQTALQGAGQLGTLGGQQFQQGMDINKLQAGYGAQQQALRQQGLSQQYEDFLNEQNYPYKQLGFFSDMIRGLPVGQQSTAQMYQAPGSLLGQAAGLGVGALGMSSLYNTAQKAGAGFAEGGSVESEGNIQSIVSKLSDQQLQQAMQAAQARGDADQMDAIQKEMAMRASERNGMAGAFNSLPQESQESMMQMAGGGVVAFSGEDNSYVIDPMLGTMQDTTANSDDRTVMERLGIFNPENRRALEKAEREIAASKEPKTPDQKTGAYAATSAGSFLGNLADGAEKTGIKKSSGKETGGISSHPVVRQASQIAQAAGVPKENFADTVKSLMKEYGSMGDEERAEMKRLNQAALDRVAGMQQRAAAQALAAYGFDWAQKAAEPGARFMGSASKAAPTIAKTMSESERAIQAAQDNADRMRLDQLRFNQSMKRGDMQSALQHAALLEQDKKNEQMLELKRQELGIMASRYAQDSNTAIQKIANDLQRNNPELGREDALQKASQIAGYSFRTDSANAGRLQTALANIEKMGISPEDIADGKDPFGNFKRRKELARQEAYRLYGQDMPGAAGPSQGGTVMRFDSKGNLIQ